MNLQDARCNNKDNFFKKLSLWQSYCTVASHSVFVSHCALKVCVSQNNFVWQHFYLEVFDKLPCAEPIVTICGDRICQMKGQGASFISASLVNVVQSYGMVITLPVFVLPSHL